MALVSKENIEKTKQMLLTAQERRKNMTPEERKVEDEKLKRQIKIPD